MEECEGLFTGFGDKVDFDLDLEFSPSGLCDLEWRGLDVYYIAVSAQLVQHEVSDEKEEWTHFLSGLHTSRGA